MGQPVAMFEISSVDSGRAREFYGRLFDWDFSSDDSWGGYSLIDTGAGEGAIGGGLGNAQPGSAGSVTVYVRVDDLESTLGRVEQLGGVTVVPPTSLPGDYGRFAMFTDPDGTMIGLWS